MLSKTNMSQCPKPIKEKYYKALVKIFVEYGCCIWDPHLKNQVQELEEVKKNVARFVTNKYTDVKWQDIIKS